MIKKHRIYATFLTVRMSLCVGYKIRSLFDKRLRFRNLTNHNILMRVRVFSYEESELTAIKSVWRPSCGVEIGSNRFKRI